MPRRAWVIGLAVLTGSAVLTSGCRGDSTESALQARLLAVADLPAGWSAAPATTPTIDTSPPEPTPIPSASSRKSQVPDGEPAVPLNPRELVTRRIRV